MAPRVDQSDQERGASEWRELFRRIEGSAKYARNKAMRRPVPMRDNIVVDQGRGGPAGS